MNENLNPFRMGLVGAAHGREGNLKKIQKIFRSCDASPEFARISSFSPEISNFCYIGK